MVERKAWKNEEIVNWMPTQLLGAKQFAFYKRTTLLDIISKLQCPNW